MESDDTLAEQILVTNGGLAILVPFLPRYFSELGLLEQQQFIDEAAAARGALLLQYLASNQTETAEHQLFLNKLLCGLSINSPVPLGIEPTTVEIELSESLLGAVIQNWEMMKNSPITSLQDAFLLREGILNETEDKWQLRIEPKAYDIILDHLPWTIAQISLPWMDKKIEVEWKTNA